MSLEEDLKRLADATLPDWGDITFSGTQFDSDQRPIPIALAVLDGYERRHGIRPHYDDASKMIEAAHRLAIDELEFDIDALQEELAGWATHGLGRAVASMTGCSPAGRRHRRRRTR